MQEKLEENPKKILGLTMPQLPQIWAANIFGNELRKLWELIQIRAFSY